MQYDPAMKFALAASVFSLSLIVSASAQQAGRVGAPAPNQRAPLAKREAPPPAVPGSRAEPPAVIPADRAAADLPPTEALFDAINRGDLPTARDSLNRGADINGTNVLGLTPLELAVDLGRNDISFLLLSLRGGNGYNTSGAPAPARPETRAQKLAAARAERLAVRAAARPGPPPVAARASAASPARSPRMFAGDGGAPVPQAGFLGFNAGR